MSKMWVLDFPLWLEKWWSWNSIYPAIDSDENLKRWDPCSRLKNAHCWSSQSRSGTLLRRPSGRVFAWRLRWLLGRVHSKGRRIWILPRISLCPPQPVGMYCFFDIRGEVPIAGKSMATDHQTALHLGGSGEKWWGCLWTSLGLHNWGGSVWWLLWRKW